MATQVMGAITVGKWWYEQDGIKRPRLTDVLSIIKEPELEKWKKKMGEEGEAIGENARNRGTLLHKLIAKAFEEGQALRYPPASSNQDVKLAWKAFVEYLPTRGWKKCAECEIEKPVINDSYGFCCTPDLACGRDRRVVEWKVAGRIKPSYWIQLHGQALARFADPEGVKLVVVRLDPKIGEYEKKEMVYDRRIGDRVPDMVRVYRAWYWEPMLKEMENERIEASVADGSSGTVEGLDIAEGASDRAGGNG